MTSEFHSDKRFHCDTSIFLSEIICHANTEYHIVHAPSVKGLGEVLEYVIQVLDRRCCMMSATNSIPIQTTIYYV
jgi:hypothetical protein